MSTSVTWPGGGTGASATAYTIPAAGELNWAALSNFLVALGQGAQSTVFQLMAVRKATTTPVTVAITDCIVGSKLAVAGAVAMNLPAGANKQVFMLFDDTGDAGTNNITITPNGADTIAGSATLVLSHNREGVILCYNSGDTDWKIVHRSAPLGSVKMADLPAQTASKVAVTDSSGFLTTASTSTTQVNYLQSAGGTTGTTSTNVVFSTSPTLVTPTLGVASVTSVNKMAITAPASSSTLAVADGKTFTANNSITVAGTDATVMTFPSTSSTVMTLASTDNCTGVKTFAGGCAVGDTSHTLGVTLNNSTTSYSPTVLNYYEEYTYSIVNGDLTANSGGGTFSSTSGTLRVTRIGKVVTVTLDQFATTTASNVNGIVLTALIVTRFRPATNQELGTFAVGVGGTGIFWRMLVASTGNIVLSTRDNANTNTAISNAAYTLAFSGTYTL